MIAVIGAMDEEVSRLIESMDDVEVIEKAAMKFNKGRIAGKQRVVVRSGIGKVNAAICTQILVCEFGADMIINTGIAGSSFLPAIPYGFSILFKGLAYYLTIIVNISSL